MSGGRARISGEFAGWFQGKEYAFDWTSVHFPHWKATLHPLRSRPIRILEIGSYEGLSAIFFLNFFPGSEIVCIDAWDPRTVEPAIAALVPDDAAEFPNAEGRFDRNLAPFSDRVTKTKAMSAEALPEMAIRGERFDLIYVDASHRRVAAYRDCMLSWPTLVPGGFMVMDDYEFGLPLPDELKPKQGIDAFLDAIAGQHDEIYRGYQIIIRKF
jgi:predicted O-methyltransferase YrrM